MASTHVDFVARQVEFTLTRDEVRELTIRLLRRLKGGDDVARFRLYPDPDGWIAVSLDRLLELICGVPAGLTSAQAQEIAAAGAAGKKGGEP